MSQTQAMGFKRVKWSKLPNRILNALIRYFVLEVPSSRAARESGINRHSADRIYTLVRKCLVYACEAEAPPGRGVHEVDESYFGVRRKGHRGRGAAGKVPVFGILKRSGRVYTRRFPMSRRPRSKPSFSSAFRKAAPSIRILSAAMMASSLLATGTTGSTMTAGLLKGNAGTSMALRTSGALPRRNCAGTMGSRETAFSST